MLRPLSVLAVVFALGLSSCVDTQVTEHQPKILFHGGESEDKNQIYVMDPDGSHVQQLTGKPPETISYNAFAAWSPDRQKIAFMSGRDGDMDIYVMTADGSDVQRLTRYRGFDGNPAWSPDGHQITFVRDMDPPVTGPVHPPSGNQSIYVMDSDGSNERLAEFTTRGSLSPDGEQIVFAANFDGFSEISVMDSDGSNVQRLTHTPGRDAGSFAPEWSPDGQNIVFDSTRDGNFEIYVMDADGSNVQRLRYNDKADARAAWSPDGQRIVFHSYRDGKAEIYVMDADAALSSITTRTERSTAPSSRSGRMKSSANFSFFPWSWGLSPTIRSWRGLRRGYQAWRSPSSKTAFRLFPDYWRGSL